MYDEWVESQREYVESVHGEPLVDPASAPISYAESVDLAYGLGTYDDLSDAAQAIADAPGDALAWLGRKAREILPDIEGKLGTIVLVGVGILALLAMMSVAKR